MQKFNVYYNDFFNLETADEVKNAIHCRLKDSGINYEITEIEQVNEEDEETCFLFTILIKNIKASTREKAIKIARNVFSDYFCIPDEESGFFYIDLKSI